MIRLLIFMVPIVLIALFINEYMKQRRMAEDNWNNQWEEKKKNFQQEKQLMEKDREIRKLKQKLEDEQRIKSKDQDDLKGFSNNLNQGLKYPERNSSSYSTKDMNS